MLPHPSPSCVSWMALLSHPLWIFPHPTILPTPPLRRNSLGQVGGGGGDRPPKPHPTVGLDRLGGGEGREDTSAKRYTWLEPGRERGLPRGRCAPDRPTWKEDVVGHHQHPPKCMWDNCTGGSKMKTWKMHVQPMVTYGNSPFTRTRATGSSKGTCSWTLKHQKRPLLVNVACMESNSTGNHAW